MRTRLVVLFVLCCSTSACGADVPAHTVQIVSNCNGPERVGLFRFPESNFDTSCSGDGWDCESSSPVADRISGDLEVRRLRLEGFEHSGPFAYWVTFDRPENDIAPYPYEWVDFIQCRWFTYDDQHDEVGERHDCFYSRCSAELSIVD